MSEKIINLVERMRSSENEAALQAVEELRSAGHLTDGSLKGVDFRYVRLFRANLRDADLTEVDLTGADLAEADLTRANLRGACLHTTNLSKANFDRANLQNADLHKADINRAHNLTYGQLTQAKRLCGATMPWGYVYDGRLSLPGDIEFAQTGEVDPADPAAMAAFYGILPEEYAQGQTWAGEHKHGLPGSEIKLGVVRPDTRQS